MIYLGVHNSSQAGAALIKDGKIIGAVTEERFNRIKNYHGWPQKSIDYLLDLANITLKNVDKIVYGMFTDTTPRGFEFNVIKDRIKKDVDKIPEFKNIYYERLQSEIEWNIKHKKELTDWAEKNSVADKINYLDHHMSHAAGAHFTSPFEKSMTFTCDGKGNFKSSAVFVGDGKYLDMMDYQTTFDSIGYFYGNVTKALGFQPERHEGKVTGLAAYGNHLIFNHFNDVLKFNHDTGQIELQIGKYYLPWFVGEEYLPILHKEVQQHKKEDVAAAAQYVVEKAITEWITWHIKKNCDSPTDVCLSGGIFANVKLNQKIKELWEVKEVYVQPAMGDMGIPLGSCLAQMAEDDTPYKKFEKNMSLGPSFSSKEIKTYLDKNNIKYNKVKSLEEDVAQLIDNGNIIGYFSGKMEYGPRALCNRSIIYHCRDKSVNDWLNKRLNRTEFMPFAPVTTDKLADKCFHNWSTKDHAADFMTMTYKVTDNFAKTCPAAVHVDNTARPQVIRKGVNDKMYNIITHYHNTRGDLALINTSFNNHEEPIVCNIEDALDSLNKNNVDVLVIENFIIYGKDNIRNTK